MRSFFGELRRRNVLRAGALYIAGVWALAQGIAQLGPTVGAPEWSTRWFLVAAVIGAPLWIAFAWFYEFTPEGLKREREIDPAQSITAHTGKKLDRWIFAIMGVAIVLLLTNTFVWHKGSGLSSDANTVPAGEHSIAVLPFVNMSAEKEQEFFSDGISEDLLNLLAKVKPLQVAARTSSFSFKGKNIAVPEIARALHVANVLDGSVRKSGNAVRITAQLVRAADGYQIWSQTWDRNLDDIFAIQDEIAAAVVSQLRIELLGEVPTAKAMDPGAYPLILQAQALGRQQSVVGRAQAVVGFQQALAISPNEGRAWAGLARVYFNQTLAGERTVAESSRLIREAANKALEIDPTDASALASLAKLALAFDFDLPAAARYYQQALEADPNNLIALSSAAGVLGDIGRKDEALALMKYRAARDPTNPAAYNNLAIALVATEQWDASIDAWRTALHLSPEYSGAHAAIGSSLLSKHDAAGALKETEAEPDDRTRLQTLPLVLYALGRTTEADAALKALIDKYGNEEPESVATQYAYRGQVDNAFEWLDKAVAIRDPALGQALTDSLLDSLHDDPRWLPFLRKIGYAPEQLAKIEFKVTLPPGALIQSMGAPTPH